MKRDEKIECKVTHLEKEMAAEKAKDIGTTVSALMRRLISSDDRIVVLGDGQEILTVLYEINAKLDECLAMKTLTTMDASSLRQGMTKIAALFCMIADNLSDLSEDEEEDDNDNHQGD